VVFSYVVSISQLSTTTKLLKQLTCRKKNILANVFRVPVHNSVVHSFGQEHVMVAEKTTHLISQETKGRRESYWTLATPSKAFTQ
jgi:hypothetical protein